MTKDQIEKAFRNNESLCHHRDDGVNVVASEIEDGYLVTFHAGEMPPFAADVYANLEQVIDAMRNLAPLAQWKTIEEEEEDMRNQESEKYIAYVKIYRSGRPERTCVRPVSNFEEADPRATHHDFAVIIGVYDSPDTAASAAEVYWEENVEVDVNGYSQWK